MKVNFKGELRRVEEREYTKKDGSKGVAYSVLVETDNDSLQFGTTKEVYEKFKDGYIYKGADCDFEADYQPRFQFGNFRVVNVVA